jgi:fructokinase
MAGSDRRIIVGLGELLWDMLPSGRQLGGAPANFAYISTLLGNEGTVASRVGNDPLGEEAVEHLKKLGVGTAYIQRDAEHATGTVQVELDKAGQPRFEIARGVAWDYAEWSEDWRQLAGRTDAVCFGSLAQRSEPSRATIRKFLASVRKDAVRVFDVNLRQEFYDAALLAESIKLADVVKLNHEELPRIMHALGLEHRDELSSADRLATMHSLKLICVTRGGQGSLVIAGGTLDVHPGYRVRVADTVGSGDAFTAALVTEYLRGAAPVEMNDVSNRMGAWVASHSGAMPTPGKEGIRAELARIQ